ncbi:divisome protein SepX/GlpR [Streptomyces sp. NBC_00258]|uniref:divisome protein SepX/GlpR n=1 Tax=Streptomyces sp. NBC_00258 TaxID=2903642 RepID=UPI002E2C2F52|nr:gephyrin-like molybdotransferase receptor GlpR [Streptomyces sp. NBC_00258]
MSSSGLIYAVIVGAWAAYLVPMWLRRQDELNEARPTERFSTAIRLLSGRAGMERRYAKDLRARSAEEGEHHADPDGVTDSVDVRAFAMPPTRREVRADADDVRDARDVRDGRDARDEARSEGQAQAQPASRQTPKKASKHAPEQAARQASRQVSATVPKPGSPAGAAHPAPKSGRAADGRPVPRQGAKPSSDGASASSPARRAAAAEAAARARRSKVLARRRRTTVMLFMAFTLGAIVAAVGGLAFLWAPGVPAVMLSVYIAYLRSQERRRFTYVMDRRRAEVAAQRLRERQPRRRPPTDPGAADEPEDGPEADTDPGLSALAADRRALVEQTDHAEWVDQQRERRSGPSGGDSWDPVPVPLPTYVTAPVAPRATSDVDLGGPDAWSSARSSTVEPNADRPTAEAGEELGEPDADDASDSAADARRAASARRARERGRTPLFDQYEDGDRPRAANE